MARVFRRRPVVRRRIVRKKKTSVLRRRRQQSTHNFKRTVYIPNWLVATPGSDTPFKWLATLADLPNYTDFTNLFDRFKIGGISFALMPRVNVAAASPGIAPPQVMSVLDYDGNGPTTIAALNQYQNIKITRGTSIHKRFFKPSILMMAYESLTGTAYVPKWNQFIDTANPTTPHYGLYGMVPAGAGGTEYDLEITYYVQCKNVK